MRRAALLAAFALLALPVEAQVYSFRTYTSAEGVPHPFTYAVTQDHFGYLWVGTFAGAARYDGERFETLTLADGLPGEDVRALAEDRAGRLWIGTNAGVARFERGPNGEVVRSSVARFTTAEGLLAPTAQTLVEDPGGGMWVGTRGGGAVLLREKGVVKTLRSGQELPPSAIWCGAKDPDGAIWFGTRGDGVVRVRGEQVSLFGTAEGLADGRVFDLKVGPDGSLYAATTAGVSRMAKGSGRFESLAYGPDAASPASSLAFDRSGALWVGRYGKGLAKVTAQGSTVFLESQGLASAYLTGLFVDREDGLWIATQGAGIAHFWSDSFAAYDRTVGWVGGPVCGFAEEKDGTIWAGSFGRGAVKIGRAGAPVPVSAADGLGNELVRSLLVSRDGTVWIGTSNGIWFRRPKAATFETFSSKHGLPNAYVTSLVEQSDGTIWMGTNDGLARRRPSGELTVFRKADGLVADQVESLGIAPDGRLWIGTVSGLSSFDGSRFETFTAPDAPHGRVFGIAFASGVPYVAGDFGVAALQGSSWKTYGVSDGLPASAATAVVADGEGAIWAGTAHGVARLSGERFVARDGMPSADVVNRAVLVDSRGRLWWGTSQGPVVYTPGHDRVNTVPPTVYIDRITAGTQALPSAGSVKLTGDLSSVTFHFVGLSFARTSGVRFRSRLVGFDPGWSAPTALHEVRYTSIPPGTYRFEIIAANNDGVWSKVPASVEVRVPTPWWRTGWAIALYVATLLGLGLLWYEVRVATLARRARTLATEVNARTSELREEVRRTRALLDAMAEGVVFVDVERRVRLTNPAAIELLESFPEGSTSLPEALTSPEVEAALTRVIEKGQPVVLRVDSGPRKLRFHGAPVDLGPGGERGAVLVFEDITELLDVDRMKSDFISTVSHELRTPLTSIRGSLSLVAGGALGELPPQVSQLIEIAARNSERLGRLINDILDMEKIEAGALDLYLERLPLEPIVERSIEETEGLALTLGVRYRLQNEAADALVRVDQDRLVQVMVNLLSNAAKFSPKGAVVSIHVRHEGARVRVDVSDLGPGIPDAFRTKIFGKFAQADTTSTRTKGGTGLGLNISKAIVEKLGGEIGFDTKVGVGTTFFFILPIAPPAGARQKVSPEERSEGKAQA